MRRRVTVPAATAALLALMAGVGAAADSTDSTTTIQKDALAGGPAPPRGGKGQTCKFACVSLFAGPALADEFTTIYGQSHGALREVGPFRHTSARVMAKGAVFALWWKTKDKSKVVKFGIPILWMLEGIHNVGQMKK